MILTKLPHNFNKIVFCSGILVCNYAPGTSNVATSISSYVSISNVVNSVSSNTVGDAIISPLLKYFICLFPFAHVIPFMVPSLFLFIIFTSSRAFSLS